MIWVGGVVFVFVFFLVGWGFDLLWFVVLGFLKMLLLVLLNI